MFLFIISFVLIFLSSYCIASVIEKYSLTRTKPVLVYVFLTAFSQIILSFEILSLFHAVNRINFLILNFVFFIVSVIIVKTKKIRLYRIDFNSFLSNISKAVIRDKLLFWGLFAVVFFILVSLFLIIIAPVTASDAMAYHVPRAVNWVINGSLSHFMTNDMRMNTMPINSELLYAWIIMYLRTDIALGFVAFAGYLNTITVLYCFLGELGFCIRKRLWTIFVFSGFAFVIIETTSCDTNMFTGSLVLSAIYLFYSGIKYKKDLLLFMSAFALSVGCGVKTTVLIVGPSLAIMMLFISFLFRGKDFYKPMLKFSAFFLVSFLIFSSYNYILNFIDYNSFSSTSAQYEYHRARGGFKGYLSSLIKYSFMLCDFSGAPFFSRFVSFAKYLSDSIHLLLIGVPSNAFTSVWYAEADIPINFFIFETKVGMGLTGLLTFFPAFFIALFRFWKSKKKRILPLFAYMYIINILLFAGIVFYASYNSRYLITFAVISSPVLVCTYIKSCKNPYKWLVFLCCCYYLLFISLQNPYKKISNILTELKNTHSIISVRHKLRGSSGNFSDDENIFIRLRNYILDKNLRNIAYFSNYGDAVLPLDILRLWGHKISYLALENLDGKDLSDYDVIIIHTLYQQTDNILKYNSDGNSLVSDEGIKVYYDEANGVYCNYVDYKNIVINKNSDAVPVFANCPVPLERFEELGYRASAIIQTKKFLPSDNNFNKPDNRDLAVLIKAGKQ